MVAPATPEISASTRYCAVLGHPIIHSASPAMHNAAIAALQLDWRYLAFDTHPASLREAITGAKAMKFIGLNLTVPHKLLAVDLVDELDESASTWGAVNTIRFEARSDGTWKPLAAFVDQIPDEVRSVGFNTDADAIARSLRESFAIQLRGADVLLLGAGGAARVTALKLASEGVRSLFLVNRTADRAREIAETVLSRYPDANPTVGYPPGAVDLIVNATSLGLQPNDPLPFDIGRYSLASVRAVFDMVYRPAETPLLKSARTAGCRTANGLDMLLYQGGAAFELWSGRSAPLEIMKQAIETDIYER